MNFLNYFFWPIHFLSSIFCDINCEYISYVETQYENTNNDE